jgi:hypothetical protein
MLCTLECCVRLHTTIQAVGTKLFPESAAAQLVTANGYKHILLDSLQGLLVSMLVPKVVLHSTVEQGKASP